MRDGRLEGLTRLEEILDEVLDAILLEEVSYEMLVVEDKSHIGEHVPRNTDNKITK